MKRILPLALLTVLFCTPVFSQDYLGDDLAFFQKKARLYQHWLEKKGMGKVLKVDKVELKKNDMELELFLSLRTTDPDSAAAIWTKLEVDFKAQNPGIELGTSLFNTFERMMEIPGEQGNVQVYFPRKDGFGYNPCFYVWLWIEGGEVKDEARINNCKAQPLEIYVNPIQVKPVSKEESIQLKGKNTGREVFQKILAYARERYGSKFCEDAEPWVEEEKLTDYTLVFSVTNLCKEVLKDEEQSLWCDFVELWGGDCNDMRRERLEFTFFYSRTDEGYLLHGSLTGKFGSGVYVPRKSGYMDMEPDFEEDYLEPYARTFQRQLKQYLEQ